MIMTDNEKRSLLYNAILDKKNNNINRLLREMLMNRLSKVQTKGLWFNALMSYIITTDSVEVIGAIFLNMGSLLPSSM